MLPDLVGLILYMSCVGTYSYSSVSAMAQSSPEDSLMRNSSPLLALTFCFLFLDVVDGAKHAAVIYSGQVMSLYSLPLSTERPRLRTEKTKTSLTKVENCTIDINRNI